MNRTEAEFALLLEMRPEVMRVWFEPFSVRLSSPPEGQPARYQPDFMVLLADGTTEVYEVKGSGIDNEASKVRAKCAAEAFPLWVWKFAKKQRKKDGGGFKITTL